MFAKIFSPPSQQASKVVRKDTDPRIITESPLVSSVHLNGEALSPNTAKEAVVNQFSGLTLGHANKTEARQSFLDDSSEEEDDAEEKGGKRAAVGMITRGRGENASFGGYSSPRPSPTFSPSLSPASRSGYPCMGLGQYLGSKEKNLVLLGKEGGDLNTADSAEEETFPIGYPLSSSTTTPGFLSPNNTLRHSSEGGVVQDKASGGNPNGKLHGIEGLIADRPEIGWGGSSSSGGGSQEGGPHFPGMGLGHRPGSKETDLGLLRPLGAAAEGARMRRITETGFSSGGSLSSSFSRPLSPELAPAALAAAAAAAAAPVAPAPAAPTGAPGPEGSRAPRARSEASSFLDQDSSDDDSVGGAPVGGGGDSGLEGSEASHARSEASSFLDQDSSDDGSEEGVSGGGGGGGGPGVGVLSIGRARDTSWSQLSREQQAQQERAAGRPAAYDGGGGGGGGGGGRGRQSSLAACPPTPPSWAGSAEGGGGAGGAGDAAAVARALSGFVLDGEGGGGSWGADDGSSEEEGGGEEEEVGDFMEEFGDDDDDGGGGGEAAAAGEGAGGGGAPPLDSLFIYRSASAIAEAEEAARDAQLPEADRKRRALAKVQDLHFGLQSAAAQDAMVASCALRTYAPGGAVVREGEEGAGFYFVVGPPRAEVEVVQAGRALCRLGVGKYFGERALVYGHGRTRNATIRAALDGGPVEVLGVGPESFPHWQDFRRYLLIRRVPFLMELPTAEQRLVAARLSYATYAPGQAIVRQGDRGDRFYMIISGEAQVLQQLPDSPSPPPPPAAAAAAAAAGGGGPPPLPPPPAAAGGEPRPPPPAPGAPAGGGGAPGSKRTAAAAAGGAGAGEPQKLVTTLYEGNFFGELALLEDRPRNASVVARGTAHCVYLEAGAFRAALGAGAFARVMERHRAAVARNIRDRVAAQRRKSLETAKKKCSERRQERLDRRRSLEKARPSFITTNRVERRRLSSGQQLINKYLVLGQLGKGQYGVVYKVRHTETREVFALKAMDPRAASGGRERRAMALEATRREVAVMKRLRHRNLVAVWEAIVEEDGGGGAAAAGGEGGGLGGGQVYLVQEFVHQGPVMTESFNADAVPLPKCRKYLRDLLSGLSYLHSRGVVHGDLKPANLLLAADGTVKIADFGSAVCRNFEGVLLGAEGGAGTPGGTRYATSLFGTPAYMAPELFGAAGAALLAAMAPPADLWSVGVTLFQMLTGMLPFSAPNALDLAHKIQHRQPEYPQNLTWEPSLRHLVGRLLEKAPGDRPAMADLGAHEWVTCCGVHPLELDTCDHQQHLDAVHMDLSDRELNEAVSDGTPHPSNNSSIANSPKLNGPHLGPSLGAKTAAAQGGGHAVDNTEENSSDKDLRYSASFTRRQKDIMEQETSSFLADSSDEDDDDGDF